MTAELISNQQKDEFVPPPGAELMEPEDVFTPPAGAVKIESDEFVPPQGATRIESSVSAFNAPPVGQGVYDATQTYLEELDKKNSRQTEEIINVIGKEAYDNNDTFNGGVSGYFRQIDIARSGDIVDKQEKFRLTFPEGSLIEMQTDDGPILLARENPQDKWRKLSLGPRLLAGVVSEPVVGSIAGAFVRGPLGVLATGIGTGVGVAIQQTLEGGRGYGAGEGGSGRIATESGITMAFDAVLRGAGRLAYGPKLPESFIVSGQKAIDAASAEGLEPIVAGQVGGVFERALFKQASALDVSGKVEQALSRQGESLLESFSKMSDAAVVPDKVVKDVLAAQKAELSSILNPQGLMRADAAQVLKKGINVYKNASKRLVGKLYSNAINLTDDVVFNVSNAQKVAKEIDVGVLGAGKKVEVPSTIVDVAGKPAFTTQKISEVKISDTPEGKLSGVINDLLSLDSNIQKFKAKGKGEWDSFEQIKTLRTRLFDLKQSDDRGVSREAGKLWNELTKSMDNPISGNPRFVSAYRTASAANRIREQNLELSYVGQILKTDTMDNLARRYFSPGHSTELEKIKELLPTDGFNSFKNLFIGDIAGRKTAKEGLNVLDNFSSIDNAGLSTMLTPIEKHRLRKFLEAKVKFEASPAANILDRELSKGEKILDLTKGTAGEVAKMAKQTGGMDGNFAELARFAAFKRLLDNSRDTTARGVEVIDTRKLASNIEQLRRDEKLKHIFRPEDFTKLYGFEKYASIVGASSDSGGAFVAGGVRQAAIEATTSTLYGDLKDVGKKLVRPLVNNTLAARWLSRPIDKMPKGIPDWYEMSVNMVDTMGVAQRQVDRDSSKDFDLKKYLPQSKPQE